MMKLIVFAATIVAAFADCKPKSTDLHVETCKNNTILTIDPKTVAMQPYPPKPTVPIHITYNLVNTGSTTYDKLYLDVSMSYFGDLFFKCGWHHVPIPISNLPGCSLANNCPLKPGVTPTDVKLDLTPFAPIISKLPTGTYYRLAITTKADDKTTVLNCLQVDFLT